MTTNTSIGVSSIVKRSSRCFSIGSPSSSILVVDDTTGRRLAEFEVPNYCDPQLEAMNMMIDLQRHLESGGSLDNYF